MANYTGIKKIKIGDNTFELAVDWSVVTNKPTIPTNTDENLKTVALTSGTTYYPILATGANAAANRQVDSTIGGLKYISSAGSTSAVGTATLYLGNSTASGTANNEQGVIRLYGTTAYYTDIKAESGLPAGNRTIYVPSYAGTMYLTCTSTTNAVGGATTAPVYVKDTGEIAAVTSIPYSLLTSTPTIPSISLNGSSTTSPSFYAPTGAGSSGQYLKSNGSGAPSWATITIPDVSAYVPLTSDSVTIKSNVLRLQNKAGNTSQAGTYPYVTSIHIGDGREVTIDEYGDGYLGIHSKYGIFLQSNSTAIEVYDATKTYSVGTLVWYDRKYYRCTTAITTAEAWTSGHWTQIPASAGTIVVDGSIQPITTGTKDLGTSDYKWNNLYATSINGTAIPSVTAKTTQAVYPVTINAVGMITGIGSAVTIPSIPSNNVTGSGTNGYLAKWSGTYTLTNGPALGSSTTTYLRNDGSWATPTDNDTKNTAGTTNKTGTKMYLAAATEQSANPTTYSNSNCYIGTDNCLYSGGTKVLTAHQNAFSTVTISTGTASTAISASSAGATLAMSAGTGISLSTNSPNNTLLTISNSGVTSITTSAGAHSTKSSVTGAVSFNVPTKTSHLTNDSGFITSYTDTKNTAGSTNTSSQIYLIGATTQAASPQTYSHVTVYVGTDGCLYSGSSKTLTVSTVKDYIISHGWINDWYYEKWSSGKVEAWGKYTTGTLSMSASGNLYRKDGLSATIPSGIFSTTPNQTHVFVAYTSAVTVSVSGNATSATSIEFQVYKATNSTAAVTVRFHCVYLPS